MRSKKKLASLGERVRFARTLGAISANKLDDLADLTKGHTSLIETGRRDNIESRTAQGIARVLGVSLDWLIAGLGMDPIEADVQRSVQRAAKTKAA